MNVNSFYFNKILNLFLSFMVFFFIFKVCFVYFEDQNLRASSRNSLPQVRSIEDFWEEQKEKNDFKYYKDFIKKQLFVLPELKNVIRVKADKADFKLEGIIWGGNAANSVVILKVKDSDKKVIYAQKGKKIKGWILKNISKKSITLMLSSDNNTMKIISLD
jgi:hypothetical protein